MIRRYMPIFAVMLIAGACGGGDSAVTTAPTTSAGATSTTTMEPAVTTTSGATTSAPTTAAPTTTSSSTTTTATPVAPVGTVLPDGRPATFVAITDDYEAVEVDTQSGEIVHVFGQTGTAAEVAAAEEMPPNVLVGIWRLLDGSVIGISDCCEPAAGNIFYVATEDELVNPYYSDWKEHGWTLSPSPTQNMFANLGYSLVVADPNVEADTGPGQWIDDPSLGFPHGTVAWTRDGSELYWTTKIQEVAALATLDLAEGAPTHVTVLPWIGVHQSFDGIGSQASGNLVGFLHTMDSEYNITETEGVVFSTTGEVLAGFSVETGAHWGGYDPTGTFLIYVDGEGAVRWQGGGEAGSLAEGFIFASW